MFCPDLRGGQYIWIFVVHFLLVVSKGFSEDDPHRKTYVVRYKNGDNTIPVTVVLDYKKQAEYVINMNPRTITKSVTFYDFKQKSIAYKDMTNRECFISHLTDETLQEENEILKELQNPVETNPLVLTLDPTRQSLTPTQIRNIAGQKIAMFCRKMATWHLQEGISQRRNRRQVELYSERKHDENGHQQHENSQNQHEVLRTGRNLTTGNSAHKRRKGNQVRRRNRNSASVNVVPKHQQNVFHRQAFYRNFNSENSQHIPNPNHGQVLLSSHRSNVQNIHNYTRELRNFQHGSNKKRPKFISSIHPRQRVNFQNFRNEHTQTPQLTADFNLPPGSSLYPRTPTVLQPSRYQLHTAEVNINHPLTFNESSDRILDEWSHPLRIPSTEHLKTSSQKSAMHFDANINAIPQNIYSDFVQPLYKTKTEPNNNQWTLPLRYNSESHKSESLINENELQQQVPTNQNKKFNLQTESVRKNTLPATSLAYIQTNDIASRDNQSLYQFSLHNTNNNNGPYIQNNLYSNLKETENSRDENQHFGEYLKSNNSKNQEIFNNTLNVLQHEHFEEHSKPVTSVEPLQYIPHTVESENSTVPNEFVEMETDKKQPTKPDSPNVEDFILLNPSEFKEGTNITFDQKTTPYHSNFSIQNLSLREKRPKPERLQNVLQLFTPDEIIIDVGKLPSPDRAGDEPRTTQNNYASTIHNDSTAQNLRTIQHHVNISKQTLRPQQRSQHHVTRQNTLLNEISDRTPYVPYNNLHSRGPIQKPQRFSPLLPPGFAMYPRHPQAPYADLASPDAKRTMLPAKFPIPQQQMSRHHQRHRRKKQRQLCCNRSPSSTEFSGCCTSRGTCCARRHRGQVPTNCCQIPKPNNTKRRSDMLAAIPEKAVADQQYQSVSDPKELCEKIKMCRTLYQSTQAVMVCRNVQVPGC